MPDKFSTKAGPYMINWTDGIIDWHNGPYWDEIAYRAFIEAETQLETAAQRLAPWEDRTGDARDGLTAQTIAPADGVVQMVLFHTVDYGVWLELIQNGRFAVIMKTLEEEAPRIIRNAMARIRYARKGTMV